VEINGVAYLASGTAPRPTVVICHGFPGNEKNLDLAQALRRAGWNAITFNYRGSWGSPGTFRFAQNPQDLSAVLAYLRDPAHAKALGIDTAHMAVVGHSMGGWVTAMAGAQDRGLVALGLISAANFGQVGQMPPAPLLKMMESDMETLAGTSPQALADDLRAHVADYDFTPKAAALVDTPLLVLTSDDGLAGHVAPLVAAIRKAGGKKLQTGHAATDHSWSDHRIDLQARVIRFLAPYLNGKRHVAG
jgi:pimeloyl-ACP methyl ester carboxylesterase